MLEDEETREREGREMEIINMATKKSLDKLSEYHTYQDNTLDRPFLTPDTVVQNTEEKL